MQYKEQPACCIEGPPPIGFSHSIYPSAPQLPYPPHMHYDNNITSQRQPTHPTVVMAGGQCSHDELRSEFSSCGICLGIFCFPCGLICCCLMTQKKCADCGVRF